MTNSYISTILTSVCMCLCLFTPLVSNPFFCISPSLLCDHLKNILTHLVNRGSWLLLSHYNKKNAIAKLIIWNLGSAGLSS